MQYQRTATTSEELARRVATQSTWPSWGDPKHMAAAPISPGLEIQPGSPGLTYPMQSLATCPLKDLATTEICSLLRSLELSRYTSALAKAGFTGADLELATEEDLESIGVDVPVHRRRLTMLAKEYATSGVPMRLLEPLGSVAEQARAAYLREASRVDGLSSVRLAGQPRVASPSRRLLEAAPAAAAPFGTFSASGGARGGPRPAALSEGSVAAANRTTAAEARLAEALHAAEDASKVANVAHEARLMAEAALDGMRLERESAGTHVCGLHPSTSAGSAPRVRLALPLTSWRRSNPHPHPHPHPPEPPHPHPHPHPDRCSSQARGGRWRALPGAEGA